MKFMALAIAKLRGFLQKKKVKRRNSSDNVASYQAPMWRLVSTSLTQLINEWCQQLISSFPSATLFPHL
jgi:hypothetical protein